MNYASSQTFDPYAVFELSRTASVRDVKKKFRSLTLKYHPDKNKRNKRYNPQTYKDICKAYSILSDPTLRQKFDQEFGATFQDLQQSSKDYTSYQSKESRSYSQSDPVQSYNDNFSPRSQFSEGDIKSFNSMFSRNRASDPNDHGYGDRMESRMTEREINNRADIPISNMFQSGKFNERDFNQSFETKLRESRTKEMMEYQSSEPMAFSLNGETDFTSVSVHDGMMILGNDSKNYSKAKPGSQLKYVDYMQGFDTITDKLPSDHKYFDEDQKAINRRYEERMSQQSINLYEEISDTDRLSFAENQSKIEQMKLRDLERQQRRQKEIVLKYKSQYPEHLLPYKPRNNQPQPHQHQPHQHQQPQHQPHQHQQPQPQPRQPQQPQPQPRQPQQRQPQQRQPQQRQPQQRQPQQRQPQQQPTRQPQSQPQQQQPQRPMNPHASQLGEVGWQHSTEDSEKINERLNDRQFLL